MYVVKKDGKTYYTYTESDKGVGASATIPDPPKGKTVVSILHTHAAYDPNYDNENFSSADENAAAVYTKNNKTNVEIYVATPDGSLKKYDPSIRPEH